MEINSGTHPDDPRLKVSANLCDIVKRLIQPLYKYGRNLIVGNWYMTYELADDLLKAKADNSRNNAEKQKKYSHFCYF